MRDRHEGFQRPSYLSSIAKEMGFDGLFSVNGEQWRRQRPMVMAGLDPAHIKSYFPALVRVTQRFARRWQRAAAAGKTIDLQADLMRYTVDVTAGLAFGADINTLESDREVIQTHLDKVFPALHRLWTDIGVTASPDDCFLALRGFRTLPIRLARHADSALKVAQWLKARPEVREVIYPPMPGSRAEPKR